MEPTQPAGDAAKSKPHAWCASRHSTRPYSCAVLSAAASPASTDEKKLREGHESKCIEYAIWLEIFQLTPSLIKADITGYILKFCLCNLLKWKTSFFHADSFNSRDAIYVNIVKFLNTLLTFDIFCIQNIRLIQINYMFRK